MEEHEVKTVLVDEQATFKNATVKYKATYLYCELADEFYKNEEQLPHLTVNGGVEDTVALAYQGPFRYLDTEGQVLSGIEKKIVLPESVEAPVQEGEAVGEAVYLLNGNRIGSVSIVTGQTVDKAVYKDYLQKVWRMFYTV